MLKQRIIPVQLPITFPTVADVISNEAAAFRRLSPENRALAILDLIASGEALLQNSPKCDSGLRLKEQDEQVWRKAYAEFFEQQGF